VSAPKRTPPPGYAEVEEALLHLAGLASPWKASSGTGIPAGPRPIKAAARPPERDPVLSRTV
jgi:hypothetical protein